MNDTPATVYRVRTGRVAWRKAGDEGVLLDLEQAVYFGLGPSAALLWPHLVDGATAEELTRTLVERAPVDEERAAADVSRFLSELEAAELVDRI